MSYVALATNQYEQMTKFYGRDLGFRTVASWDRPTARGCTFDLGGLRLEILDAARENRTLRLEPPADRVHLVVEVDDVEAARAALAVDAPAPEDTSWGTRLFRLRDPDGTWVTYLQPIHGPKDDR
jgi:catechol 2,3-dioxygenase-like lactoylglutathione lyase family enzyme